MTNKFRTTLEATRIMTTTTRNKEKNGTKFSMGTMMMMRITLVASMMAMTTRLSRRVRLLLVAVGMMWGVDQVLESPSKLQPPIKTVKVTTQLPIGIKKRSR